MTENDPCACNELADLAIVPMGCDGQDERVFESLERKAEFGQEKWWLSVYGCKVCEQKWLVGSDERIHDNYCFKRIDAETFRAITEHSKWPEDFQLYEQVLRLSVAEGAVAMFLDPQDQALIWTAEELIAARPEITVEEIAFALNLTVKQGKALLQNLDKKSSPDQPKQGWNFLPQWLLPRR